VARKRKDQVQSEVATAAWQITLTDLMTLLMTFFVVLVSLSVFDERSKHYALESVSGVFGAKKDARQSDSVTPTGFIGTEFMNEGQTDAYNSERNESLINFRKLLLGDAPEIRLSQNARVLVLSFNSDLLFEPEGLALSARGRALLDKLVPYVTAMRHPMRIAGHSSPGLQEAGQGNAGHNGTSLGFAVLDAAFNPGAARAAWTASMERGLAVYRHFLERGANPAQLAMEAHGDSRPRFSNDTPEGRQGNSRIDLVLDKRNQLFAGAAEGLRQGEETKGDYYFKDFRFELEYPEQENTISGAGSR
jgi:chemotaxis protein MotB